MINKAYSTEIDYGDIPENMNEEQMRAYLALESKIVMPSEKRRDSFEQQWNSGRGKMQPNNTNANVNNHANPNANNTQSQSANANNNAFSYQPSPASVGTHRQQPPTQNPAAPTANRTNSNHYPHYNRNGTVSTISSMNSSTYAANPDYDPSLVVHQVDRMSTVTIVTNKKHRREHSFRKQPVANGQNQNQPAYVHPNGHNNTNKASAQFPYNPNMPMTQNKQQTSHGQNNQPAQFPYNPNMPMMNAQQQQQQKHNKPRSPPKSALTAQIAPQKHHLANQESGEQSGVAQSRNAEGKMVIKQLPYSKKTHVMVNCWVEIKPEHVEQIIVYFNKHLTVQQFLDLLKNETNNAAFKDTQLQMFCADDDGDLEDDFPPPEPSAILASVGLKNFYIKLKGATDEARDDIRRSTLAHKQQLLSTEEMDKMHSFNEDADDDEDDEDEYEDDEEEEDGGCKCVIL